MKYKGRFQTFKLSCLLKGGLVISYIQKSINLTNSVKMLAALDLEHISQFVGPFPQNISCSLSPHIEH